MRKIKTTLKSLGLGVLWRRLRFVFKLWESVNWTKTIYFNFKSFPLRVARKLPVFIYGKVKITRLSGDIQINGPIRPAMIEFGKSFEVLKISSQPGEINIQGKVIFEGYMRFGHHCSIFVHRDGVLRFGNMASMGSSTKIFCYNQIELDSHARISFETQLMDTNFHRIIDLATKVEIPTNGKIFIGKRNWIGNRSTIMKGTVTPDDLIMASNSLSNKDMSFLPPYSLVGGTPAKLIRKNMARDWIGEGFAYWPLFK